MTDQQRAGEQADVPAGNLAARIGERLRSLRQEQSLTLTMLAAASGVSVSYLSAVENGVNLPSLQKLGSITAALGVGLPYVLAEEGDALLTRGQIPDQPAAEILSHSELLLQVAVIRADPAQGGTSPVSLAGRDLLVFIQEGEVTLTVDDQTVELAAGDALECSEQVSITWHSPRESVAIWSSCPSRLS